MVTKRTLTLKRPASDAVPADEADASRSAGEIVEIAIRRRRCLSAVYNRGAVVLAPVLLYREHADLFLIAGTIQRDGKAPREPKLGNFRVSGLVDLGFAASAEHSFAAPEDWSAGKDSRELIARLDPASVS